MDYGLVVFYLIYLAIGVFISLLYWFWTKNSHVLLKYILICLGWPLVLVISFLEWIAGINVPPPPYSRGKK